MQRILANEMERWAMRSLVWEAGLDQYSYRRHIQIEMTGLFSITALALFLPDWSVAVRRYHDTNRMAWYLLIPMNTAVEIVQSERRVSAVTAEYLMQPERRIVQKRPGATLRKDAHRRYYSTVWLHGSKMPAIIGLALTIRTPVIC